MTRRLETALGALFALLLCGLAYLAGLNTLGEWVAHVRWIGGFSAQYPDLSEWPLGGARTANYIVNPLWAWGVVILWAAVVWRAAWLKKKEFRLPWMLASMGGLITGVGMGDVDMAVALFVGVAGAWALLKGPVKPLCFAIFLSVLGVLGTQLLWATSLANPPPSLWIHYRAGMGAALVAIIGSGLILRRIRGERSVHGVWISALITACAYIGVGPQDFTSVWFARMRAMRVLAESPSERRLNDILKRYRLDEWEASMQRYPDSTSSTNWHLLPEVLAMAKRENAPLVSIWLKSDEALFSKKSPSEKIRLRDEVLREIACLNLSDSRVSAVARELEGWLRYNAGDFAGSEKAFVTALNAYPRNSQTWYGLSLVFAKSGRLPESAEAYAIFCLLEPRAIFSPALTREPLAKVESEAQRLFIQASSELSGFVTDAETNRWKRYAAWRKAWSRSGGDARKFIADTHSPRAFPESVECVRERIGEVLRKPDEKRAAAIISSSVALLANRHLNVGQALDIYKILAPSRVPSFPLPSEMAHTPPLSIEDWRFSPLSQSVVSFKTRPVMYGWLESSSIDAGGAGSSVACFEENLLVRLLAYGLEDAKIKLPETWLRTKLEEL